MAVFLAEPVHDDLARLVGIEHSVGDYILFCDPTEDDPALLAPVLAPVHDGYDLVVADSGDYVRPGSRMERSTVAAYGRIYTLVTGAPIDLQPTGLRVLSRAASLYVAGRQDAELMLRARRLGHGFPATTVPIPPQPARPRTGRSHTWSKGIGLLLSVSALPMRGASYAALFGGILSALYSIYVVGVFLFKSDVAEGWTTLSLQLSGMMFVFSIVLMFLSEYVIQIHATNAPRSRRYLVIREIRSPLSRRTQRLNVVDAEGRFQLGKPTWLTVPGGDGV